MILKILEIKAVSSTMCINRDLEILQVAALQRQVEQGDGSEAGETGG